MTGPTRLRAAIVLVSILATGAAGRLAAQGGQAPPPEYKDVVAASQLQDPASRLRGMPVMTPPISIQRAKQPLFYYCFFYPGKTACR